MTRSYLKPGFNMSQEIRNVLGEYPLCDKASTLSHVKRKFPRQSIKSASFTSAYYIERRKVHSRTTQRTTGFNQSRPLDIETLKSAATLIDSVGKQNAVDAITLLAKLMK